MRDVIEEENMTEVQKHPDKHTNRCSLITCTQVRAAALIIAPCWARTQLGSHLTAVLEKDGEDTNCV